MRDRTGGKQGKTVVVSGVRLRGDVAAHTPAGTRGKEQGGKQGRGGARQNEANRDEQNEQSGTQ